jgi:hypothetical protein
MSGVLDRATAHFDTLRGQKIEVPEWGDPLGEPLVLMFDPLTLAQRQNVQRRWKGSDASQAAGAVMLYARTADGGKAFEDNLATLEALTSKVDPAVVARIAARMLGVEAVSDAKNA